MLNSTRLEPGNATGVETNVLARLYVFIIFRSSHCMAHTRKGLCFINSGVANDRIEMEQSRAEQITYRRQAAVQSHWHANRLAIDILIHFHYERMPLGCRYGMLNATNKHRLGVFFICYYIILFVYLLWNTNEILLRRRLHGSLSARSFLLKIH